LPETAVKLMRSRYAAYALDLCDYIIETTHKDNPNYETNLDEWRNSLHQFSKKTRFDSLTVIEFIDGDEEAFVTFTAYLRQDDADIAFTEKSTFHKVDGRWLYRAGEIRPEEGVPVE
jgi:SEC-C motif-containing protein